MLKINKDKLIMQSLQGKIHHPLGKAFRISYDGEPMVLPATGGITYNVHAGDPAFGWEADHVEPAVSIRNDNDSENAALLNLSCVGNMARVMTGDAKGEIGYLLGGHGGIDHSIIEFSDEAMSKMAINDTIMIKSFGQGLKLLDYPQVKLTGIDPNLLQALDIEEIDGKLHFPVTCEVPAVLMGSGIGSPNPSVGDYDIMTQDKALISELGIDKLKFGDFVLLRDCDCSYGRGHLQGAVTIGIVIHSDCIKAGHGPGIATFMTCKTSVIVPKFSDGANIKNYIGNDLKY